MIDTIGENERACSECFTNSFIPLQRDRVSGHTRDALLRRESTEVLDGRPAIDVCLKERRTFGGNDLHDGGVT